MVDSTDCLRLLDHVDSMLRWCSVNAVDRRRFELAEASLFAVAYHLAGLDDVAARLIEQHRLLDVPPV